MATFIYRDRAVVRFNDFGAGCALQYFCPTCGEVFAKHISDEVRYHKVIETPCDTHITPRDFDIWRKLDQLPFHHWWNFEHPWAKSKGLLAIEFLHVTGGLNEHADNRTWADGPDDDSGDCSGAEGDDHG